MFWRFYIPWIIREPKLPNHYLTFLSKIRIIIYGATKFERKFNYNDKYCKVFHYQALKHFKGKDSSMCLIGIEDLGDGRIPDGCTDILLPIFYDNHAANQCHTDEYVFYVDAAFGGAYKKELQFKIKGEWITLYTYKDARLYNVNRESVAVGYIEYCPSTDSLCWPKVEG